MLCENGLYAGSAVCTGNTIAFCNDVVVAAPGDTCTSIASGSGAVINVDGERVDKMFQVLTSCHHRRLIFDVQDVKHHSHLCATTMHRHQHHDMPDSLNRSAGVRVACAQQGKVHDRPPRHATLDGCHIAQTWRKKCAPSLLVHVYETFLGLVAVCCRHAVRHRHPTEDPECPLAAH